MTPMSVNKQQFKTDWSTGKDRVKDSEDGVKIGQKISLSYICHQKF